MILPFLINKKTVRFPAGLVCCLLFGTMQANAQQVGMSFSYFFPKGGSFSNPVSPLSLRGVGIEFTDYFAITSGFSLYHIGGIQVKGLPFEPADPVMGPYLSLIVPLEGVISLPIDRHKIELRGGGFGFFNFGNRIHYGNLDRAIRAYENWEVANADFKFDNKMGFGYHFGAGYTYFFNKKMGINIDANYFIGQAEVNLRGTYTGGSVAGGLQTKAVEYPDTKIDFTGLEIGIGIVYKSR